MTSKRETMPFDVVIVGGGPAGLAAAIRLRRLCTERGADLSVCVIEKGAEIGAHILSGAVIDPRALDELLPDWRTMDAPLDTPVAEEHFAFLTEGGAIALPTPPSLKGRGCFVASLGNLCRWLAARAEEMGVEIFPGFAGADCLFDGDGSVRGIATGDMGRLADGSEGPNFTPGVDLEARHVLLAEGCRGHLSKRIIARHALDRDAEPPTYGLGIKEIWDVDPAKHRPGRVFHSIGYPLDARTYGGGFLYHMAGGQVAVGLIVGLDYANPHLDPFMEFQKFKAHPAVRALLDDGRRVAYGARALSEGGLQSLPRTVFPGGALIGDAAGTLDVSRLKGVHMAMKSGMLAAEAAFDALTDVAEAPDGDARLRASWVGDDLHKARNIRPAFAKGLWGGLAYGALEAYLFRGRAPWTLRHGATDAAKTGRAADHPPIAYPKPDGRVTFDRPSSVFLSGTAHAEDQPCHLRLRDPAVPTAVDWPLYGGPEARFCPAGVYEFLDDAATGGKRLHINAANCVHCKTCDIKDPTGNIDWIAPQGGDGPNYPNM